MDQLYIVALHGQKTFLRVGHACDALFQAHKFRNRTRSAISFNYLIINNQFSLQIFSSSMVFWTSQTILISLFLFWHSDIFEALVFGNGLRSAIYRGGDTIFRAHFEMIQDLVQLNLLSFGSIKLVRDLFGKDRCTLIHQLAGHKPVYKPNTWSGCPYILLKWNTWPISRVVAHLRRA